MTSVGNIFGVLGGISATVSAVAAARSARIAGAAFRPFVISQGVSYTSGSIQLDSTLSNEGLGGAIDVRFRVGTSGWSPSFDAIAPNEQRPWSVSEVSLTERWKEPDAREVIGREIGAATVIVEFSGLDATRWRVVRHGASGRQELQRLTPRWLYWWRKL